MIWIDLIYNLALLVALSVVSGFVDTRWKGQTRLGAILQGVVFGGAAVIGMLRPFVFAPGLIFDGRSVMISLGALFFGPWTAAVACLMTIPLRVIQGGPGTVMGVSVILASAAIGVGFHRRRPSGSREVSAKTLLIFGVAVHLAMLALTVALPREMIWSVLKHIGGPVILIYPLATVLIGKILSDHAARSGFLESLQGSEQRFRAIFNTTFQFTGLLTRDGTLTEANQTALDFAGVKIEEVIQRPFWETRWFAGNEARVRQLREAITRAAGGAFVRYEVELQGAGTTTAIVDFSLTPVLDSTGQVLQLIPEGRDITARKRTEEALRTSQERLERVLETVPDGIAIVNLQGLITFANSGAERLLGLTRTGITQRTYNDPAWKSTTVDGQPFPDEQQPFARVVRSGEPVYAIEQVIEHPAGRRVVLSVNAAPLRDATGALIGTVTAFTDITERKQAEHAVRESEERYRGLFTAMQEGFALHEIVCDAEGRPQDYRYLEVNPAFERITGIPRARWIGHTVREVLPHVEDEWIQGFGAVALTGAARTFENYVQELGRHYEVMAYSPKRGQFAVVALDVTERKRAEAALRQGEASLALAQRIAHLGSWEVDLVRNSLTWSDETYRIFGLTPEAFTPTREAFLARVHPEDRQRLQEVVRESICLRKPYALDHRILRPDGSERIVSERADVLADAAGNLVRLAGTVQDVTELKRAEQALQRSERHFRSIIDTVQDLISIVDVNGVLRFISPSSQHTLGYAPEQLLDREVFDYIPPDEHASVRAALARALGEPHQPVVVQHRFRHADGSWRLLESIGNLLGGETSQAVVVNSRDITDRRRLEDQLRQSQKMEAIGQLAAGVAHDFNNLLTIIQGNASLLLGAPGLSGEDAGSTSQIIQAAERAAGLTRQLLMFSRKQVMQLAHLDLNEVVGNMTKMLQRILGEDISLRSEYAPNLPLIHADAGMLEQVLLNLAVNARDAMPDGGQLRIQTSALTLGPQDLEQHPESAAGHYVRLSVSDTGCGIAPENLPRIFDPFFTTKEVGKGTGLGLATVYGIVKQHRGWIEASSELSRGTTFQIYLPATEMDAAARRADAPAQEMPRGREVILVVEDERAVRLLVNNLLQRCGYTVLMAESGVAALDVWKEHKHRIELLLTDMVMPDGMSGRELAQSLKRDKPDLKVIYTSGYSAATTGQVPPLTEGVNFLQKPYPPYHLAKTVRACLDRA